MGEILTKATKILETQEENKDQSKKVNDNLISEIGKLSKRVSDIKVSVPQKPIPKPPSVPSVSSKSKSKEEEKKEEKKDSD